MTGSLADRVGRAERAARLRSTGWSLRQIARKLGVADSTVRADLRAAAAPFAANGTRRVLPLPVAAAAPLRPPPPPRPWSGDWRPEATRLRAAGHPDHQRSQLMPFWMIAERLAVDEGDVRRHFARLRKRESRADRAVWLRTAGQSLRQIATALGVSVATVQRDLADRPVSHLPARKVRIVPGSAPAIAHPDDTPPDNVVPLRRIAR